MKFSVEQIMDNDNYNEVCKIFFTLAKNEVMLEKLKEILHYGKSDNYYFKSNIHSHDNPRIERERRIAMASLFIRNPKTFSFFEQNNINIFHGTNANALPGILKYGMNSLDSLKKEGVPVLTGEKWSRTDANREFISFTDVLNLAEEYSFLDSLDGDENLSFSVVIGVTENEMKKTKISPVDSDFSEIGVLDHFPLESISCICVPEDKVEFVKKIMTNYQIPVLGMSDLNQKGYYIEDWGYAHIYRELYESKDENSKKFSFDEIEEVAMSRSLSKMKVFVEKIKTVFEKGKEEENGRYFR